MLSPEIQLTYEPCGHTLNSTQCFSPDDEWIVFDGRNEDSRLAENGRIAMVAVHDGSIQELYKVPNQGPYGPGAGAATFCPAGDKVLFLAGIRNADESRPYSFTRRTGVAVHVDEPMVPHYLDARNIIAPFTPGALRGGTHAHTWSHDGRWISFTYNDFVLEQASRHDPALQDLRTVGVMTAQGPVPVPDDAGGECHTGEFFACLVTEVTAHPRPGSDEISRAFDETWIGQTRAIAFQGSVKELNGESKTEIFVVDLPDDITKQGAVPLEGTTILRPGPPLGTRQRRITHTEKGVTGPRHWLRTTGDGSLIGFLSTDREGTVQIFGISPHGGSVRQLTHHPFSIEGPFNFHGNRVAYAAGNQVWVTDVISGESKAVTRKFSEAERPAGAIIWSNAGRQLAYNRRIPSPGGSFLQIFVVDV